MGLKMEHGMARGGRSTAPVACAPMCDVGLPLRTPVHTRRGYVPACDLQPADKLAVFPHGFCAPAALDRPAGPSARLGELATAPQVRIPALALGIHGDILLQPATRVLFMDPDFRPLLNTPWVTVAAADLVGFRGISHVQPDPAPLVVLRFDSDQIITIDDGFRILVPAGPVPLDQPAAPYGDCTHPVVHLSARQAQWYLDRVDGDPSADESAA